MHYSYSIENYSKSAMLTEFTVTYTATSCYEDLPVCKPSPSHRYKYYSDNSGKCSLSGRAAFYLTLLVFSFKTSECSAFLCAVFPLRPAPLCIYAWKPEAASFSRSRCLLMNYICAVMTTKTSPLH